MLVARNYQPSNLVRLLPEPVRNSALAEDLSRSEAWRARSLSREEVWAEGRQYGAGSRPEPWHDTVLSQNNPEAVDPLYLFACQLEWERGAAPSAAWEVISAARSPHADTRAHARSLLERSQQTRSQYPDDVPDEQGHRRSSTAEAGMRTPYGLEIIESCMAARRAGRAFSAAFHRRCCDQWMKTVTTALCRQERCCLWRGRRHEACLLFAPAR